MGRSFPVNALDRSHARILFHCASGGALVQGLARVIEAHLPHSVVDLVEDPLRGEREPDVRLLLLYGLRGRDGIDTIVACHRAYPDAALGLVVEGIEEESALYGTLFDDCIIQGVLPLDFELDVWLAAVSVLLGGGEFYPFSRRRTASGTGMKPVVPLASQMKARAVPVHGQNRHDMKVSNLTPREYDILKLISEGHQNKVIADRMGLSEHTVKVHVHNLIAKLHVTNRTQAAIAFLASEAKEGAGASGRGSHRGM